MSLKQMLLFFQKLFEKHTAQSLEPSFFQESELIVYKLLISFGLDSSHALLLGLQLRTRSLS